jgi:hypothetical protein
VFRGKKRISLASPLRLCRIKASDQHSASARSSTIDHECGLRAPSDVEPAPLVVINSAWVTTLMNSFTRLSRRSEELGLIKKCIRQEDEQEEPEPEPDSAFQTNSKQFKAVQTKK